MTVELTQIQFLPAYMLKSRTNDTSLPFSHPFIYAINIYCVFFMAFVGTAKIKMNLSPCLEGSLYLVT